MSHVSENLHQHQRPHQMHHGGIECIHVSRQTLEREKQIHTSKSPQGQNPNHLGNYQGTECNGFRQPRYCGQQGYHWYLVAEARKE
jgi:hypothetical protein